MGPDKNGSPRQPQGEKKAGIEFLGEEGKQVLGDNPINVTRTCGRGSQEEPRTFVDIPCTGLPCRCSGECKLRSLKKN